MRDWHPVSLRVITRLINSEGHQLNGHSSPCEGDLFHYQNERRTTIFACYMVSVDLRHVIDCLINTQKREDCALSPTRCSGLNLKDWIRLNKSSVSVYAEYVAKVSVM